MYARPAGRATVKHQTQRRVNQQQQKQGKPQYPGGPKKNKENVGNARVAPIGVSGTPLSSRFSSLQRDAVVEKPVAAKAMKKHNTPVLRVRLPPPQAKKVMPRLGRATHHQQQQHAHVQVNQKKALLLQKQKQKMQQVAQANRTKRQDTVNKRRPGLQVVKKNGKPMKKAPGGKNAGGAAGQGKGRPGKPDDKNKHTKKKPVTGDDLDVEMDSYWHAAGKGPDPHAAQLDRQMEEYWAGKPKQEDPSSE